MTGTDASGRSPEEQEPKVMQRVAPPLTARTGDFWRSGEDGRLRIAHCRDCGWYMHPPMPVCAKCRNSDVGFDAVSGQGHVHAFTINRYQWFPGMAPPYVIATIELIEQPGLLLTSNVIGCPIDAVEIGMPVNVAFEKAEDTWIPVFQA